MVVAVVLKTQAQPMSQNNASIIEKLKKLTNGTPVKARGLGDVVAMALHKMGVPACESCRKRRDRLNKAFPFKRNKDLFSDKP